MEYNKTSINNQNAEDWTEQDEKKLENAQNKYKRGKKSLYNVMNNDYGDEPNQEGKLAVHKPYSMMTQQEKDDLLINRFNFIMSNAPKGGMSPDVDITTLGDIYNTGYLDVWMKPEYRYDPYNMPDIDVLEQRRWEMNKDDNLSKMFKTFGKTTVDGFVKSAQSWVDIFNYVFNPVYEGNLRTSGRKPEMDFTGTFWEVLANGYSPMVNDPSKRDSKFTKEYWMNQFAQMGTSIGMVGEMVLEGLLLHGIGEITGANALLDATKARFISSLSDVEKLKSGMAVARKEAAKSNFTEATRLLNETKIGSGVIEAERSLNFTHDVFEGSFIALKNASLNYQFNLNEEYTREMRTGNVSEEEAIRNAHTAAWNTFKIEVIGSALINISQSRLLNNINRSKWDNFIRMINAGSSAERAAAGEITKLSTKGLLAKNIGRFAASQIEEGLEEVWEDGMALYGRQMAYIDNKEKWDKLGLAYYMSEDTHTLVDSFIGGVMGGAVISGARLGFNAITQGGQYSLQKKQIERYNKMVDNFQKNIDAATFAYIKEQKELTGLDESFKAGKDIEITNDNGEKVVVKAKNNDGSENAKYKEAYNKKREEISDESNKRMQLFQAIINATTAIEIVEGADVGNSSSAVTENILAIKNKINAIQTLLDKQFSEEQIADIDEEKRLENEIAEAEAKNQDSSEAKRKLDELHTKWVKNGETDEMAKLRRTFEIMDVYNEGKRIMLSDEILEKELNTANQQLVITEAFNKAFFNYFTGINTDVNAALRYATNEAYLYVSQITGKNDVDSLLSYMDPVFNSVIESSDKAFGIDGNDKKRKVAFAYAFFSRLNKNNKFDSLLQTLVNYMSMDSGYVPVRGENGTMPVDFKKSLGENEDADAVASYQMYAGLIDTANSMISTIKNMENMQELIEARDKVYLFQEIFSKEDGAFNNLKNKITVKQYKKIVRLLSDGSYEEMYKYVSEINKHLRDGNKPKGKLFVKDVEENAKKQQDADKLAKEIKDLSSIKHSSILESLYKERRIGENIEEKKKELDDAINEGKDDKTIDKIKKELQEAENKKAVYDYVKKTLDGEKELSSLENEAINVTQKIQNSTPEYNKRIEKENKKREVLERITELENNSINNFDEENVEANDTEILSILNDFFGIRKLTQTFVKGLQIESSKKKEFIERIKKAKNTDELFVIEKEIGKLILQPSPVVMSEEESKKLEEAKKEENILVMFDEVNKLNDEINEEHSNIQAEIAEKEISLNNVQKELKELEVIDSWDDGTRIPVNKKLHAYIEELKTSYKAKEKESQDTEENDVSENVFKDIATFESFFIPKKDVSSKMFEEILNVTSRARRNIEYMNAVGKENNDLLTYSGRKRYMFKVRLNEIMAMPETTGKELYLKYRAASDLAQNASFYRRHIRKKKVTEDLDYIIKEVFSYKNQIEKEYNSYSYNKEKAKNEKREAEKNDIREILQSELEKALTKKELRRFKEIDLYEMSKVKEILEELKNNATDEKKSKIDSVIAKIDELSHKDNENKLSEIVEEQKEKDQVDESVDVKEKPFTIDDAKPNTIYYLVDNKDENLKTAEQLNKQYGFEILGIQTDMFEFADEQTKILIVSENENGKIFRQFDKKGNEIGDQESFDTEDDEISNAPTQSSEEDSFDADDSYSHIKKQIDIHFNKTGTSSIEEEENAELVDEEDDDDNVYTVEKRSDVIKQLLRCASEFAAAGVVSSDWENQITDNTNGKTFIQHVMDSLGLSKPMASTYISMIARIAGCSPKTIFMAIHNALLGIGGTNVNPGSYGILLRELGLLEMVRTTGMKETEFNERVELAMIDNMPTQQTQEQKQKKGKDSSIKKFKEETGVDIEENRTAYSGNKGFLVHQNFETVVRIAGKDKNDAPVYRVYRVPKYTYEDGTSIIGEEGIKALNKLDKDSTIYIENDIEEIYNNNRKISLSSGDDTEVNKVIKNIIGTKSKEWSELTEPEKESVKKIMAENAIIRVFSDKNRSVCIGFLPMKGHFSFATVKVPIENEGTEDERVTNEAKTATAEKIKLLNEQLASLRNAIVNGDDFDSEATSLEITLSTENGALEQEELEPSGVNIISNTKVQGLYKTDGFRPYKTYEGSNRKSHIVLPGQTGVDVNEETGRYAITTVSNSNMSKPAFMLSETMPAVHYDTKAKLCKLVVLLLKDYLAYSHDSSIILENKELLHEIISWKETEEDWGGGSENFENVKKYIQQVVKEFYVTNSSSDNLRFRKENDMCSLFSFGGTNNKKKGYFDDNNPSFKNGFRIFLGDKEVYEELGEKSLLITWDKEGSKNLSLQINTLIKMLFGGRGEHTSLKNLETKLDSLSVGYSQMFLHQKKSLSELELYSNPQEGYVLNDDCSINGIKTNFADEISGKVMSESSKFSFITKYENYKSLDEMERVDMESESVNIAFGKNVNPVQSTSTKNIGVEQQKINKGEEEITGDNVVEVEVDASDLGDGVQSLPNENQVPVGEVAKKKKEDEGEDEISNNLSHIRRKWMYNESDMFKIASTIFSRLIDKIQNPTEDQVKRGKKRKEISDITSKDIELELMDYLNLMRPNSTRFSKLAKTLFEEFKDQNYTEAVTLTNAVLSKYPFLNRNMLQNEAEKWFAGELNNVATYNSRTVANQLFWCKVFNPEMFDILFKRPDSYFNTYIANVFMKDQNITLDDELSADNTTNDEINDMSQKIQWDHEQDPTTPVVSTISYRVRLLLSTIRKKKAKKDMNGAYIKNIDGNLETENDVTSQAVKDLGLYEIYDLYEVLNFLREMGTRNIKPTWTSYVSEIKKVAEGTSNMAPLAQSILEVFQGIADERVITEIKYKMGTKAKCRFRYLAINEMTSVDESGEKNIRETHMSLLNSRIENPNDLFYQLKQNVVNGFENPIFTRRVSLQGKTQIDVTTSSQSNGVSTTVYTQNFKDYIKYFTSRKSNYNNKSIPWNQSYNLYHLFEDFIANGRWDATAIQKNMAGFSFAIQELSDFLFDIYGYRFDNDSLYQVGWNNIDDILKTIRLVVKSKDVYTVETDKQGKKNTVPLLMKFKSNRSLFNLLKIEVRNNNLYDEIIVRSGGKNVQTITDRSFSDWQVIELHDRESKIREYLLETNSDENGLSWSPMLAKRGNGEYLCEDDEFYHGLFDISVCRYKGEFSGKITEMNDTDQLWVRSLMYFDTTNMNYDLDMHHISMYGQEFGLDFRYATVSDFTDSNKTKSGYWRLLSVIPKLDVVEGGIQNGDELFNYVHHALFTFEVKRIMKVLENPDRKNGELLFVSNMSYNNLVITAKDSAGKDRKWTLAQYLVSDVSSNEKKHFLETLIGYKNNENKEAARNMTLSIINDSLHEITGAEMQMKNGFVHFKLNDSDVAKSLWMKCGLLKMSDNSVLYRSFKVNDDNNSYTKNINKISSADANSLVTKNPKMCYLQAALDFVINDIVNSHFILNTMYGGALNYIENDLNKDNGFDSKLREKSKETDIQEASNLIVNMAAKLVDRVYKRMAGVMTGGNVPDYSICYANDKSEESVKNPWGGADHMEYIYLNCKSEAHSYSADFAFYAELYFPERYNENKKYLEDIDNIESRKKLMENYPELSAYLDIDSTDGQEYCSWREAIDTMLVKSSISRAEYNELKRIYGEWPSSMKDGDEERAKEILRKGLQVFKPVYFGAKIDGNNERISVDYVKTSLCPLFPNFSYSMKYDAIRQAIEALENKTHRNVHFVFDSGIKVGGNVKHQISLNDVFEMAKNGKIDTDVLEDSSFRANRKYFSIQNETDTKIQTKLDHKNEEKRKFDDDEVVSKLNDEYYNIPFCIASIENALGVDFSDKYLAKALVREIASIMAPKFMSSEQRRNKDKAVMDMAWKNAYDYLYDIVFDKDGETKEDYIENLKTNMYKNKIIGFTHDNLKHLCLNVNNSMLYRAAYLDIYSTTPKEQRAKARNEKVEEIKKKNFNEQYKYIKDIFDANGIDEKPVYMTRINSFIEKFTKKEGDYAVALTHERLLDSMYYDMAENIELKTVELTQLEHMITSNGISKISKKYFEIPTDVISNEIRSILGGEFVDSFEKSENGKYIVNGYTLEQIRNAYEITESFKNMINLLYDKENGFGIIDKKLKNEFEAAKQIPDLNKVLSNRQIMTALKKRILKELESRDIGTNASDLIKADVPIIFNPSLRPIEYLLMSLVKKNISRTYLTGSSFFLMSPNGFGNTKLKKKNEIELSLDEMNGVIWLDRERGTGPLRTAHKENGEFVMAECAIAPQFTYYNDRKQKYEIIDFYATKENGEYIYLVDKNGNSIKKKNGIPKEVFINKNMLNPEVLKMISLRVPTSGLMNSCAMKIVAFLPSNMAGTIIVPQEHIAQFGEDFDIDKRFCYLKNWIVKDGKIDILQNSDIADFKDIFGAEYKNDSRYHKVIRSMNDKMRANRLIDIYMSVLSCPKDEVQQKINLVLNWDILKKTKREIVRNAPKNTSKYGIIRNTGDLRTQIDVGVKSSSGLRGTGAWSNKIVFSAILSKVRDENGHGVIMKEKGKTVEIVIAKGEKDENGRYSSLTFNGDLSSAETISDNPDFIRTKMEVDAAQQNVNLDTVKEDIIAWINQNTETLPFFMMMSFLGYDMTDNIIFRKMSFDENGYVVIDANSDNGTGRIDLASMIAVQPIIRRLSQLELHRHTILKNYDTNLSITEQLLKEFGFDQQMIDKLKENKKFSDSSLGKFEFYRINENGMFEKKTFETDNKVQHYFGAIKGQILYQNMYRPAEQIKESDLFKQQQLDALAFFMYVRSKGHELQKYRSLLTVNSRGIGKEYLSVQDKIKTLNDLGAQKSFYNLKLTIGEFRPKSGYDFAPEGFYDIKGCDYFIKPNTAEGNNLIMSIIAANSIVGSSIGYTNTSLNEMFDNLNDLYSQRGFYQDRRDKMKRRSVHDMQMYLYLMLDSICKSHGQEGIFREYKDTPDNFALKYERVRLIKDEYKKVIKGNSIIEEELAKIGIDDTFYRVIGAIMQAKPKFVADKFLSHFSQRGNGTLDFNIKANQSYDKMSFSNALLEMWREDKKIPVRDNDGNYPYNSRDLVKDIVALAFIMDDQQGMNNFKNLIPVEILQETGMIDAMKTLGTLIENDKIDFNRLFEQIIGNNVEILPINKKAKPANNTDVFISDIDISSLQENGIYNENYNEENPYSSPFIEGFRVLRGSKTIVCILDSIDTENGKVIYKKRTLEKREGSGRNAYNPFADFFEDDKLTPSSMEEVRQERELVKKTKQARISSAENTVDKLKELVGDNDDAFVKLFEKIFEDDIYEGFEINIKHADSIVDKDGNHATAQVQRTKGTMKMQLLYTYEAIGIPHIVHEEMMHCLLGPYIEGKFDNNGKLKDSSISKRFNVSLDIYNKLHDYYNSNQNKYAPDYVTGKWSQLANIFQGRGSRMAIGFNEFLSNIMSCDPELREFIEDYEKNVGYESQYDNDDKSIIDRIFDFIQEIFEKICQISGIHKDVANEVLNMISDIYLINNNDNVAVDRIQMIDRFKMSVNTIGKADVLAGFVEDIKESYKPTDDAVSVTTFATEVSGSNETYEKITEKVTISDSDTVDDAKNFSKYGFVPRYLGTFVDYAFRKIFAWSGTEQSLKRHLLSLRPEDAGIKPSALTTSLHLDSAIIDMMLEMKRKIIGNGGIKAIANSSEIKMVSDFSVNGKRLKGVPDLIVVDNNNNVYVVDFKTFMIKDTETIFDADVNKNENSVKRFDSYVLQVELYKMMLAEKLVNVCHVIPSEIKIVPYILEIKYRPTVVKEAGKEVKTYEFEGIDYVSTKEFSQKTLKMNDDGDGNYTLSFIQNPEIAITVSDIYSRSRKYTSKINKNC